MSCFTHKSKYKQYSELKETNVQNIIITTKEQIFSEKQLKKTILNQYFMIE